VLLVALAAESASVLGVGTVQSEADQLTLRSWVVVCVGAGREALWSMSVAGVGADAQGISSQYSRTEPAVVAYAVATLLSCASCPLSVGTVLIAASLGAQLGAAGDGAGLECPGHGASDMAIGRP